MKVVFHEDFYQVYTGDQAAASGRMEAIVETIEPHVEFVTAEPAVRQHIAAVHSGMHIQQVENQGLYEIAALPWPPAAPFRPPKWVWPNPASD